MEGGVRRCASPAPVRSAAGASPDRRTGTEYREREGAAAGAGGGVGGPRSPRDENRTQDIGRRNTRGDMPNNAPQKNFPINLY